MNMSEISQLDTSFDPFWITDPTERYKDLAQKFRPVFNTISQNAAQRDQTHTLPTNEIEALKKTGFAALRIPIEFSGSGATIREFFALLIELAEADSNIAQAIRGHSAFVEDLYYLEDQDFVKRWRQRIGQGITVGNAMAEIGAKAKQNSLLTQLIEKNGELLLDGSKYYTTGSLYADWIEVSADNHLGEPTIALVPKSAEGVNVVDDWDGFGQTLTASGSSHFNQVKVDVADTRPLSTRFGYATAFFQLYHLATIAGIARALTKDVAHLVKTRTRVYSHGAGASAAEDPQILQVVGAVRGAAYAASAIVMQVATTIEKAAALALNGDAVAAERAFSEAELETAQAQTTVIDLVLDAATRAFDAVGASSTKRSTGLDRHWRNVRTIACHNPRVYKQRIVGDYAVNGTLPPFQWLVGEK